MSAMSPSEPFKGERRYRIRKTFTAMRDHFREGEILTYKHSAYSRYDGITGYFFIDEKNQTRSWDLPDEDSTTLSTDLFEAL